MNIQIFGRAKCFDTKKAQRYFKERRVKYQFVDLNKYGLSRGELRSVMTALGGFKPILNTDVEAYKDSYIEYLAHTSDIEQKIIEMPILLRSPIVRNGNSATIGYAPEVWTSWK